MVLACELDYCYILREVQDRAAYLQALHKYNLLRIDFVTYRCVSPVVLNHLFIMVSGIIRILRVDKTIHIKTRLHPLPYYNFGRSPIYFYLFVASSLEG